MREIKFRIWHKVRRKMFPVTGLEWGPKGLVYILYPHTGAFGNSYRVEPFAAELIQYTGLHDKDGVEIYEGDIIEYDWLDERVKGEVKLGKFNVEGGANTYPLIYGFYVAAESLYDIENVVRVGNIFENPELLEDTN